MPDDDKLTDKLAAEIIDGLATVLGERTKKGLYNAGDLSLTQITMQITKECDRGTIDVEEMLRSLNGLSYTKDLTRYLGRTKKVKFSYNNENCD